MQFVAAMESRPAVAACSVPMVSMEAARCRGPSASRLGSLKSELLISCVEKEHVGAFGGGFAGGFAGFSMWETVISEMGVGVKSVRSIRGWVWRDGGLEIGLKLAVIVC